MLVHLQVNNTVPIFGKQVFFIFFYHIFFLQGFTIKFDSANTVKSVYFSNKFGMLYFFFIKKRKKMTVDEVQPT